MSGTVDGWAGAEQTSLWSPAEPGACRNRLKGPLTSERSKGRSNGSNGIYRPKPRAGILDIMQGGGDQTNQSAVLLSCHVGIDGGASCGAL